MIASHPLAADIKRSGRSAVPRKRTSILRGALPFAFTIILASMAYGQPHIVIDPPEWRFSLPQGVNESGVVNVANDGDSVLVVEADQQGCDYQITLRILLWTRFANRDWEIENLLASLTALDVNYRVTEYDGDDPDEFDQRLRSTHVLLVPEQSGADPEELHSTGRRLQDVLLEFVYDRGGFVVGLDRSGSTAAFLGVIILAGVVVNNGIVMIDYVNQLRKKGMEKHEALIEGAATRLRPVLITALSTVIGVLPMALSRSEGWEMRAPLAVVLAGGLLVATFLTLFVVPAAYSVADRISYTASKRIMKTLHGEEKK